MKMVDTKSYNLDEKITIEMSVLELISLYIQAGTFDSTYFYDVLENGNYRALSEDVKNECKTQLTKTNTFKQLGQILKDINLKV